MPASGETLFHLNGARVISREHQTRQQIRKRLIRLSLARQRLAPLMVIANTGGDRQPAARDRVTRIEIEITGPIGAEAFAIYPGLKISRGVLDSQNHVS